MPEKPFTCQLPSEESLDDFDLFYEVLEAEEVCAYDEDFIGIGEKRYRDEETDMVFHSEREAQLYLESKRNMPVDEANIAREVEEIIMLQDELAQNELAITQDPAFAKFLAYQKETKDRIDDFWKKVETSMVENGIKNVKGEWGTITIAERINWLTTSELPAKFTKKVVDTKKITDTFRLEGKAPKGATPTYTKYLTKRIKGDLAKEVLNG